MDTNTLNIKYVSMDTNILNIKYVSMVISIRQHLSYIWSFIGEKLSNTDPVDTGRPGRLLKVLCTFNLRPMSTGEADFKKSLLIKNSFTYSLAKFSVFPFLITVLFFEINTSVELLPWLSKKFYTKRFCCMIAAFWNCKHFRWICELKHLVIKD